MEDDLKMEDDIKKILANTEVGFGWVGF
jgi:hypothetical protein